MSTNDNIKHRNSQVQCEKKPLQPHGCRNYNFSFTLHPLYCDFWVHCDVEIKIIKGFEVSSSNILALNPTTLLYFLPSQVAVSGVADVRSWVPGNESKPDRAAEPTDGKRHRVVPQTVGQDVPAGGREAVWAGSNIIHKSITSLSAACPFPIIATNHIFLLSSFFCLSSDQHPPEHSVWCRNRGGPVDCGISSREGDQQPVCVELGGWAGKRHRGSAGDAGREEGEVGVVGLQQLVDGQKINWHLFLIINFFGGWVGECQNSLVPKSQYLQFISQMSVFHLSPLDIKQLSLSITLNDLL